MNETGLVNMMWLVMVAIAAGSTLVMGWLLQQYTRYTEGQVMGVKAAAVGLSVLLLVSAAAVLWWAHWQVIGMVRYGLWVLALLLGGGALLCRQVSVHWSVQVLAHGVQYQLGMGAPRYLAFADIVSYREVNLDGRVHWRLRAKNGWQVDVPMACFEAEPLRWYVRHHVKAL